MQTDTRRLVVATVRHALPVMVEGTVVPVVLFTVAVHALGVSAALWSTLLWSGSALGRRLARHRRISGILVLTGIGTAFRLVTVLWTSSPFVFFLQPVLATMAIAFAFGLSVPLRRPLAARLGADLVPLEEAAWAEPEVRKTCSRLSLVWCAALSANAMLTLWILWRLPVATFVLVRPFVGVVSTLPAVVVSFVLGAGVVRRSAGRLCLQDASPGPVREARRAPPAALVTV